MKLNSREMNRCLLSLSMSFRAQAQGQKKTAEKSKLKVAD